MRCSLVQLLSMLVVILMAGPSRAAPPVEAGHEGLLPLAEAALLRGANAHAVVMARAVLRDHPGDIAALKVVATGSCLLGDPVTARQSASRLPWLDQVLLAELCAAQGIVLNGTPILLLSHEARRLFAGGILQLERGQNGEALRLLRRAFRLEPSPQILFEIARCQMRTGQLDQAVATHRRYVRAFREPRQRLAAAARFGVLVQEANGIH